MKTRRILIAIIAVVGVALGLTALKNDDKNFNISKNLNIFATLFRDINLFYVDEIDPDKTITTGINAMLNSLDPYTVYYPESDTEDIALMTTGEYAGIGSVVSKKGDYVIIREPYKNSPADKAGLLPGDIILSVDGQSAEGKDVSEVSDMLKGQAGKEITLKVRRQYENKPLEKKAIREKIQLPSVPFFGMANDTIGYIYLSSFTDKAAADVRNAIISLKNTGAKALILDLRGNAGGLLDQAIEIVNYFVPRNSKVVSTKGKIKQWDKEYFAGKNPIVPDMPLETVRDLTYNTKLKVTTAKYYIPSGRCIQALDYSHRNPDGSVGKVPDSLITEYQTLNGRKVYDGGGITPDVKIEPQEFARITQELVLQDLTFDFVNDYALRHPQIAAIGDFRITPEIYDEFKAFLKTKEFSYETESQRMLERLVEIAKAEKYYDSSKEDIERLKDDFNHSVDRDMNLFKEEITTFLAEQFIQRYYYQEGLFEYRMHHDDCIDKALEVLADGEEYAAILNVGEA